MAVRRDVFRVSSVLFCPARAPDVTGQAIDRCPLNGNETGVKVNEFVEHLVAVREEMGRQDRIFFVPLKPGNEPAFPGQQQSFVIIENGKIVALNQSFLWN